VTAARIPRIWRSAHARVICGTHALTGYLNQPNHAAFEGRPIKSAAGRHAIRGAAERNFLTASWACQG